MSIDHTDKDWTKVEFDRGKIGRCNICGATGKLSWDHVPPKGGITPTGIEILPVGGMLTAKDKAGKTIISQNGIKYRTICERCNNERLGKGCDPALNTFAGDVGRICISPVIPPRVVRISAKPLNIMKGVLGHLLAANTIEFEEAGFNTPMRECFLNPSAPIPDMLHIFYWVYPYPFQVIKQDIGMPARRGRFNDGFGFFKILKYFPVAYLVTDLLAYEDLSELTVHRRAKPGEIREISIRFDKKFPWEWPDNVDPGNFILMGATGMEGIHGKPRMTTRR